MVGFRDEVRGRVGTGITLDGSEYNDWDVVEGRLAGQFSRRRAGGTAIAVGITDNQVGPLLSGDGSGGLNLGGLEDLRSLAIEQGSQYVARFRRSIDDEHTSFGRQRLGLQEVVVTVGRGEY